MFGGLRKPQGKGRPQLGLICVNEEEKERLTSTQIHPGDERSICGVRKNIHLRKMKHPQTFFFDIINVQLHEQHYGY